MRLSRRRLLLTTLAWPLVACTAGATIARFDPSGPTARPGGRGLAQPVNVHYELNRPATVEAIVRDASGKDWPLRETTDRLPGEEYQVTFDGTVPLGTGGDRQVLPDGAYELRLTATEPTGARDVRTAPIRVEAAAVDPLDLTGPTLSHTAITPDGDGVDDEVRIGLRLSKDALLEVAAQDAAGARTAILPPAHRPAGEHQLLWEGSSGGRVFGGKRLPDGQYTIVVTARDDAGNVRVRQAPLRIANGGVERLEIVNATIEPGRIRLGDQLRIRVEVANTGETVLRTMGPPPGTHYRTGQSHSTLLAANGRPYEIVAGAWRIGLGWKDADQELPLRWGLLPDIAGTIAPGGRAIVEAVVTVDRLPSTLTTSARFWVGAMREGIGMTSGRVGDRVVELAP